MDEDGPTGPADQALWSREAELSRQIGSLIDEPAVWAMRPSLLLHRDVRARVRSDWRYRVRTRATRVAVFQHQQFFAQTVDGVAAVWRTVNQRRAFGSLVRSDASRPWNAKWSPQRTLAAWRTSGELAQALVDESPDLRTEIGQRELRHELHFLLESFIWIERWLDRCRPRAVVVSTQHSPIMRAVTTTARSAGVPVVYVPHAPLANNPYYADLPFDRAFLRGPREIVEYTKLGAAAGQMTVVGDLSLPSRATAPASDDLVVAPSPWGAEWLKAFFAGINEHFDRYTVCLHPRMSAENVRRWLAPAARIAEQRTVDHLLAHGGVLVQHGSGVAIEAMLIGVPAIDFDPLGGSTNYFAITEPHVPVVTDGARLQAAVTRAVENAATASLRAREWALEWSAHQGTDAESRLRTELQELSPSPFVVLDGWTNSGSTAA